MFAVGQGDPPAHANGVRRERGMHEQVCSEVAVVPDEPIQLYSQNDVDRTHQSNQFFLLDCAAQTKLLRLTVPDNLTFKTYAKNAHKLSYLSEFFVRKYATSKNTLHAYIGLFSHSSYVKGTALTRFHCPLEKISILVEGGCSYSKSVRGEREKGKEVLLFTRGPRSIVGA